MKIILFEYVNGCEITIRSGDQDLWNSLSEFERNLIRTLLEHDNGSCFTGKTIKMGSTIARMEME